MWLFQLSACQYCWLVIRCHSSCLTHVQWYVLAVGKEVNFFKQLLDFSYRWTLGWHKAGTLLIGLEDKKPVSGVKCFILRVVSRFLFLLNLFLITSLQGWRELASFRSASNGCLRLGLRSMKKTIPIAHTSMAFKSPIVAADEISFSKNTSGAMYTGEPRWMFCVAVWHIVAVYVALDLLSPKSVTLQIIGSEPKTFRCSSSESSPE